MQFRPLYCVAALVLALGCHVQRGAVHRVEAGDTLLQISHAYGVDLSALLAANHFPNPNELKPGQKVLIPGAEESKRVEKGAWEIDEVTKEDPREIDVQEESRVTPPPVSAQPKPKNELPTERPKPRRKSWSPKGEKLLWPAEGAVAFGFGKRNGKMHNGIDLRVSKGAQVNAIAAGNVVYEGQGIRGYGNLVIVSHGSNWFSVYAYLGEIVAKKGTPVAPGARIGNAMSTHDPFVHIEIRRGKIAIDPLRLLPDKADRKTRT